MKRAGTVLTLGLLGGLVGHLLWLEVRRPDGTDDLAGQLDWMRGHLQLDARQFARVHALHEQLRPQLEALATDVRRLRAELVAFEEMRRTRDEVDFVAYAKFLHEQQRVDRACDESTQRLVAATVGLMTPVQRERYKELLAPALTERESGALR